MIYKYNDLKEFLIKCGEQKVVGFGNNKRNVYECRIGHFSKIKKPLRFAINYDGDSVCVDNFTQIDYLRYNVENDCIQSCHETFNYYGWLTKWKKLNFDKDGNLKCGGYDIIFFSDDKDVEEYKEIYFNEHIEEAKKNMRSEIIGLKSAIKTYQKKLKKYEDKLMQLTAVPSNLQNHE